MASRIQSAECHTAQKQCEQSSTQATRPDNAYLFLFLTTMTTVNNEIATANNDIQSAVLISFHFLGN